MNPVYDSLRRLALANKIPPEPKVGLVEALLQWVIAVIVYGVSLALVAVIAVFIYQIFY